MSNPQRDKRQGEIQGNSGEFLMTEADFTTIARLLYEDAGIALSPSKTTLVYSRLAKRLRALGLASFKDYCEYVAGSQGASERMTMLAALTTNVTHFFRENHHFEHLKTQLLPPLLAGVKRGGKVRIWSAGCSNGHEPYSIAMTILSLMPDAADYDVKVLASDIDPNVVAFGRAGVYDAQTLEAVPAELRRRWFSPVRDAANGMSFEVSEEMREIVSFRELNLIGDWPMRGKFNAIFCRNVTIYFDQPTRERIWARFCDYLEPEGWFYMGHSERLTGPAAQQLTYAGTTAYRRGGGGAGR
ncbi:CheR family methyltransferase [Consotaella salsifontis]|uniref:Chemotaxis protein methyltransferase n=1 Tax=Consotaella salsifontis TaxID=1365950 RepID=A0A1T4T9V0_9HYPH|nr:protein-glutamate O-methyltransferase [Consotaella salsifontis]SKA37091.1 MCP methyltransferase, CheR-type [Consotaella salsifontis]